MLLIFLVVLMRYSVNGEYSCILPEGQHLLYVTEPYVSKSRSSIPRHFRITPLYTKNFERSINSERSKREIVEYALEYWSKAMKPIEPLTGPLRLSRQCINNEFVRQSGSDGQIYTYCTEGCSAQTRCFGVDLPSEYLNMCRVFRNGQFIEEYGTEGSGLPNSDYAVLVDMYESRYCESDVIAYAGICQVESKLDRPVLGYINFCPRSFRLEYPHLLISRSAALHELAHAFGFSPTMHAFFRDENGQPRTPRDPKTGAPRLGRLRNGVYIPSRSTVDYVVRKWLTVAGTFNVNRTILKTPNILKYAREHFGCPDLEGLEMENQGGDGTASAHFEKRIVLNEIMAGSVSLAATVSKLTLAYFLDTGWYEVDMTKAESYTWARNAGCSFARLSCYEYMEAKIRNNQSVAPWCNQIQTDATQCLSYTNAYGSCNLKKLKFTLHPIHRYFKSISGVEKEMLGYYGGASVLTDFCPYTEGVLQTWNYSLTAQIQCVLITITQLLGNRTNAIMYTVCPKLIHHVINSTALKTVALS